MTSHRFTTPTVVEIRDPRAPATSLRTLDLPLDGPPDDWVLPPLARIAA